VSKRQKAGTAGLAAIIIIAGLAVWWPGFHHAPKPSPASKTSEQQSPRPTQPPTAGGRPIPQQFWAKARSLGYYCPSWAAQPGQIVSHACIKLDQ